MIEIPLERFRRSNRFQSNTSAEAYGSYHHQYIQVVVASSIDEMMDSAAIEDFVAKSSQPVELVNVALRNMAAVHEYRHFYDCFGTTAGISLFGTYLIELKEFLSVCLFLDTHNMTWQLPIWDWIDSNNCPDPVLKFAKSYRQRVLYREIFMGGLELPPEPGLTDEIWRDCKVPQLDVVFPIYPLQTMSVLQINGQDIRQQASTIWHSIGFETIVEGNAQALQRSMLEALWPGNVAELAWEEFTRRKTRLGHLPDEVPLPQYDYNIPSHYYNVTDYLVTKYLGKVHGIKPFPRTVLAQISDIALMESAFPKDAQTNVKRHPGDAFTHVIKTTKWAKPLDTCVRDCLFSVDQMQNLIDGLSEIPRPEILFSKTRNPSIIDVIAIIESYVQHEIVVPLLKLRIEHGHKIFYDFGTFLRMFESFPKPLVCIHAGQFRYFPPVPTFLHETWAIFVILRSVLEQIMSGSAVIYCPRAYQTVAGLDKIEFVVPGSCNKYVSRRACLVWSPSRELFSQLPKCLFSDIIRQLRLG